MSAPPAWMETDSPPAEGDAPAALISTESTANAPETFTPGGAASPAHDAASAAPPSVTQPGPVPAVAVQAQTAGGRVATVLYRKQRGWFAVELDGNANDEGGAFERKSLRRPMFAPGQDELLNTAPADPNLSQPAHTGEDSSDGDDGDEACGVCGSKHSEEEDALIFCDGAGCGVAVHQLCYNISDATAAADGDWFCEACQEVQDEQRENVPLTCVICESGRPGGTAAVRDVLLAFKRATSQTSSKAVFALATDPHGPWRDCWAHVACAAWVPEAGFVDENRQIAALCGDLSDVRAKGKCDFCGERGQIVQCKRKKCVASFHPTCILRELMGPRAWSRRYDPGHPGAFCRYPGRASGVGDVLCGKHCGVMRAPATAKAVEKSEYEKERDARIAQNQAFLATLGLGDSHAPKSPVKRNRNRGTADGPKPAARASPRACAKVEPGKYALGVSQRTPAEIEEAREEREEARLLKLLRRADKAAASAAADDAKAAARFRRFLEERQVRDEHEARRLYDLAQRESQAAFLAREREIEKRRRARERADEQARRRASKAAAALKKDADKAARVADKCKADNAVRDAKRQQKLRKRAQRPAKKQDPDRVYRDALQDARNRARVQYRGWRRGRPPAQAGDRLASKATIRDVLRRKADSTAFAIGDAVEANYQGAGLWYAGRVARVGHGYDVAYADGEAEADVPADRVRRAARAAEPRAPPRAGAVAMWPKGAPCAPPPAADAHAAAAAWALKGGRGPAPAAASLLPACCFCGGGEVDPDDARGCMVPAVFLGDRTKAQPDGVLYRCHQHCAELSPEVSVDAHGMYRGVIKAAKRGAQLTCAGCGQRGATVGCAVAKCSRSFHAHCATQTQWRFGASRRFFCQEHRAVDAATGLLVERDAEDAPFGIGRFLGVVSGRWCPQCEAYDPFAQAGYVACDGCRAWWHPACGGVGADHNEGDAWTCPRCVASRVELAAATVCVCGASALACKDDLLLMCDSCDESHHPACVGLSQKEAETLAESDESWHCPSCLQAGLICVCRKKRTDAVTIPCEKCHLPFHPACVNVDPAGAPLYNSTAPDRKLLLCPTCFAETKSTRGGGFSAPPLEADRGPYKKRVWRTSHVPTPNIKLRVVGVPVDSRTVSEDMPRFVNVKCGASGSTRALLPEALWAGEYPPQPRAVAYVAVVAPAAPAARRALPPGLPMDVLGFVS